MYDVLVAPFALPFMQRPLLVLLVLGVAAGVIGVFVSLRSLEFVSDGLVHAVFPGLVIGFVAGGRDALLPGALAAAVVAAVVLTLISRRGIGSDSAIAVVFTALFGLGVVLVSQQEDYAGQLQELLFGRLLTVTTTDVLVASAASAAALLAVGLTAKEQLFRAFDEQGARAAGYRTLGIDLVLAVAIAVLVVIASSAVGNLLALGLILIPGAAARLMTGRLWLLFPLAIAVAVLPGWLGLALSYTLSIDLGAPVAAGGTVAVVLVALYLALLAVTAVRRRRA